MQINVESRYEPARSKQKERGGAIQPGFFIRVEKCALRIRNQNQPARRRVSSDVCSARLGRPDSRAQIAAARFPRIRTNSAERSNARPRGDGNNSAKFFVHPSRSCAKLRYIRVRTASPP